MHWNALQYIAMYGNILQSIAMYCIIAMYCNMAIYCNNTIYIAIYCNIAIYCTFAMCCNHHWEKCNKCNIIIIGILLCSIMRTYEQLGMRPRCLVPCLVEDGISFFAIVQHGNLFSKCAAIHSPNNKFLQYKATCNKLFH